VVLGGVYASTRISGQRFKDMTIMFLGAGSAAIGIGDLIYQAFRAEGLSAQEARRRLWFIDVDGLVVASRDRLDDHVTPYAHDHAPMGLEEAIRALQPNLLIGATGVPGTFTEEAVRLMAEINDRPGIFALSNPTSRAECTALEAYEWTDGRAIYASGSPFPPVAHGQVAYAPGQANNVYVFPGIGLGALSSGSSRMTDEMFLAAARTLADHVDAADLQRGSVYPPLRTIRDVSKAIAVKVASIVYNRGLTSQPRPDDLEDYIASLMFDPTY